MQSVEDFSGHFDRNGEELLGEGRLNVSRHMLERCPVAHTNADGGYWVVSRYDDVLSVITQPNVFSSGKAGSIPRPVAGAAAPPKIPINIDPPLHRDYRRLMNPYLTPQTIASHEREIRELATELIDGFIVSGRCEFVEEFAKPLPATILFRILLGIDIADIEHCREMAHRVAFGPLDQGLVDAERAWMAWTLGLVQRRRSGPRQDDLIDGMLHNPVEDRLMTDDEVVRALMILFLGGFSTTTDAASNIMLRLARDQLIQKRLRDDPAFFSVAVDEFLRIDPPVTGLTRHVTQDVEIGGCPIPAGDRIFWHIYAANHDEREFPDPDELHLDRERNRHLAFGGGPHRCIGSNVARLTLRVAFEELLRRLHDIELSATDTVTYPHRTTLGPESLPIIFRAAVASSS